MDFLNTEKLLNMAYAAGMITVGYLLANRLGNLIDRTISKRFSKHHARLASRGIFYLIFGIFFISALQHLGFHLSVLLGAAGIFTVAISFASQTAASNLISGIFLLFERPFKMGDNIEVNQLSGVVESIDLLSTKLKTPDNKLVRIPNETLIKSEIVNLNYFKVRRVDLSVRIAYNSDISDVKSRLLALALHCPNVLTEPEPQVTISQFTDVCVEIQFMVWAKTKDISSVKNQLLDAVKQQFESDGIKIPPAPRRNAISELI